MWMIVGLGNPGSRYEMTRHNAGFLALDQISSSPLSSQKFDAFYQTLNVEGESLLLVKPQTFMNLSGKSVQAFAAFYKIPPEKIIVIHDEIDLPVGALRIKQGGGDNGQRGVRDIAARIGPNFIRIRIGVGRPSIKGTEADYVLHNFGSDEFREIEPLIVACKHLVLHLIKHGLTSAQNQFTYNTSQ